MNNPFFNFVEKYWDDLAAFFKALREFFETLSAKLGEDDTAEQ